MSQPLDHIAERMLAAATAAGATDADTILTDGTSISIELRAGELEQAERAETLDIGLRVFVGERSAIVSSSDSSPENMILMAQRAVAMAQQALADPYAGLATGDQLARDWNLGRLDLHDRAGEPAAQELRDMAQEAEAASLQVAGVTQPASSSAGYSDTGMFLATTTGFAAGYRRTSTGLSCGAISGEGSSMERDYDGDHRIYRSELRTPEDIGRSAGERAAARHGARQAQTGQFPVLFDERISSTLIGHLLSAMNGAVIARGASWLLDKLGTQVLPDGIDLHEDPHRPRRSGSRPFDAEALPTRPHTWIKNGELTGYLLDLSSARKLGREPTGNAVRGVGSAPVPSASNLELTQGDSSREDLVRQMGTGLLVTSLIGSTINPNTGDYSRGASGFWVERGEIVYPVNQVTIADSLPAMLRRIVPANDARPHLSRVVPSILIDGMSLAGA